MHDGQPTSTCPVSHENISTQAGDHSNNNHVMRAIRVHKHGGPDVLTLDTDVPKPELLDQQVKHHNKVEIVIVSMSSILANILIMHMHCHNMAMWQ